MILEGIKVPFKPFNSHFYVDIFKPFTVSVIKRVSCFTNDLRIHGQIINKLRIIIN